MKNIKTVISSTVLFVLFFSSCSTIQHSYRSASIPNKNIISGEVVVDTKLDLNKKVEATSSLRNSVEEAKEEAYYKAITQNNIDVIVDPIYQIKTTEKIFFFGGKSIAKITGFGAIYVNPRTKVEAIGELTKVDTTNINKFNAIYFNKPLKKTFGRTSSTTDFETSASSNGRKTKKSYNKNGWGVELANMTSDFDSDSNPNSSICFGIFNSGSISKKVGVYYGLGYSTEGSTSDNLKYIRAPFMFKYEIFNRFNLGAGVQIGICISSDLSPMVSANTFDYGLVYGLGYRVSKSLSVNLKTYAGISEALDNGYKNINSQLGLTYHF